MAQIDARLVAVSLGRIRPTQMTAGFRSVTQKHRKWKGMNKRDFEKAASNEFFPGVIGPKKRIYITDHHHSALALLRKGDVKVKVGIQDDLSMLSEDEFWVFMDHRSWVHCYDTTGRRKAFEDMPKSLLGLADDPYRSLAAEVRLNGGFAKLDLTYLEFLWANFFRANIDIKLAAAHPAKALAVALRLARSRNAAYLPGWVGKS